MSESGSPSGEEKNTTVAIRLRPLNERERLGNQGRIWRCVPSHNSVTQTTPEGNPLPDSKGSTFFTYDRIFDEDSTTQQVYEGVARELVHSVVRGINSTIFAYGQTSSGKTFTMQGGDNTMDTPGIVQMAARDLFTLMDATPDRVFLMRVSYLEIYQEDIRDLLNPDLAKLQVREDPRKGVYIDAHEEVVADFDHVLRIVAYGEQKRHVGCTEMNSRSSRSHTLFRLVVESQQHYVPGIHDSEDEIDPAVLVATLNLVDLAGSESVRHTGATGLRQKEGGNINRSLLTLSQVIQKLSQGGTPHVNYRDSKLTRILQPSLSGNASMAIICCATPAEGFLEETRSTLQFASRAKQIKTRAVVNEVLDDKAQIRRMSQELAALRRQHAEQADPGALQGKLETLEAEKAEQAAKIERLGNLLINLAHLPAAAAVDVDAVIAGAGAEDELHLDVSPRSKRTKRSRETWCPGESVPMPQGLADRVLGELAEEEFFDRGHKRRSGASSSWRSSSSSAQSPFRDAAPDSRNKVLHTPLSSRTGSSVNAGVGTTPTLMSPARARAEQQVVEMRERLVALQEERDAKAAKAEATEIATARVSELELEVGALKESLEAASQAATAAEQVTGRQGVESEWSDGTEEKSREVEEIAAKLEEAEKAKEALKAELEEFCEYTDKKDEETVKLQERLTSMEEALQQTEAELDQIRAAEEREARENALRVEELQSRVVELETAINERDAGRQEKAGRGVSGNDGDGDAKGERDDDELAAMKAALEECQRELAEHKARAEEELQALLEEMSSTKVRLADEKLAAERAAQEAAYAVAAVGSASEAADATAARQAEATAALQDKVTALESEKAEIEEEAAELRALNDDAAALLADHGSRQAVQTDGETQTETETERAANADKMKVEDAKKMVADAHVEVAERDRALATLQARVEQLEGNIVEAETEQEELDARSQKEKEQADEALARALAAQRRAEDALSAANQSQLELRCRLEEAIQQVAEAEAARDEMVQTGGALNSHKDQEIAALGEKMAESELQREAAIQAKAVASGLAEEAAASAAAATRDAAQTREELEAHRATVDANIAKISELEELVSSLNSSGEKQSELEAKLLSLQEDQMNLISDKEQMEARVEEVEAALAVVRAENEAGVHARSSAAEESTNRDAEHQARVQELSGKLAASVADADAVRAQLADTREAANETRAEAADEATRRLEASFADLSTARAELETGKAEISRLEQAAKVSVVEFADLRDLLDAKNEELAKLNEAAESFEARLAQAVQAAADTAAEEAGAAAAQAREEHKGREAESKAASNTRIAELESQLEDAKSIVEKEFAAALENAKNEACEMKAAHQSVIADMGAKLERAVAELTEARASVEQVTAEAKDLEERAATANGLTAELETVRQRLASRDEETTAITAKLEAEEQDIRGQLAQAQASAATNEEDVAQLRAQAAEANAALREAELSTESAANEAAAAAAAAEEKDAEIARLNEILETNAGVQDDLALALDESESLSKEVLDLTDELMEKEANLSKATATIAELREQIEAITGEIDVLREASSTTTTAATAENAEDSSDNPVVANAVLATEAADMEIRRLKIELDHKGSEIDNLLKESDTVRAELKEMKAMLNAAEQGAYAAGADDETLRKRLSQLLCENGLLKGEKDRRAALDESAKAESRSVASRAAGEVERLERELEVERKRADKAAALAGDGDNAKATLVAMEAKLADLRQERTQLTESSQRSLERCADAEAEAETLRSELAKLEARGSAAERGAFVVLETRVDELEEAVRRADASRIEAEGEVRQSINRAKRLQGEVDMMRSEYEIVSEEATGLRGRVSAVQEGREELQRSLAEAVDASKAMEEQLRHRLETQVAEAESLRHELAASRERSEQAEAAARAAEQRTRDSADEKTAALLGEMEAMMEEKLAAEAEAQGMKGELGELRESLASAEQRAAEEQSLVIKAAQERMAGFEEATAAKDRELQGLQALLERARASEATAAADVTKLTQEAEEAERRIVSLKSEISKITATAAAEKDAFTTQLREKRQRMSEENRERPCATHNDESVAQAASPESAQRKRKFADMEKETAARARRIATLEQQLEETAEVIAQKDARIKRLEEVRLTKDQVAKLNKMKMSGKAAAEENKELKKKLKELEKRVSGAGDDVVGLSSSSASPAGVAAALARAAAADERVVELTGAKETLLKKVRGYGARIHQLETENSRVRAAVEDGGFALPEGRDLSEVVLEVVERAVNASDDASFMSSATDGDGAAVAAAVAVAERHHAELKETREALRRAEVDRVTLQDQMRAGVSKFRALEAQEVSAREKLEDTLARMEVVEEEAKKTKEAMETAARNKEKSSSIIILEEENLQLYKENKDLTTKTDRCKAELQTLQGKLKETASEVEAYKAEVKTLEDKLASASQSNCNPASTRTTPKRTPLTPRATNVTVGATQELKNSTVKKPPSAAAAGERRVPVTAAERRRQSVALLQGDPTPEEGVGECNQS